MEKQKERTKKERKLINPHDGDISYGCSQETNPGRGLGRDWPYSKHPRYHERGVTLKLTHLVFVMVMMVYKEIEHGLMKKKTKTKQIESNRKAKDEVWMIRGVHG